MANPKIEGGYILLARKITISDIMKKPPLYMKLWVWMLESANRKNGYRGLERGQFFTTKNDMREAMSWMVGYRKVTPTEKEIRNPYEWFLKGSMIVAKKVTHGTLVTICNYDEYQNPKNYEGQSEGQSENPTKGEGGAKYKQEVKEIQDNKLFTPDGEQEKLFPLLEPGKPKTGTHEFIKWWCAAYQFKMGKKYIITNGGKFGKLIKALLSQGSLNDLKFMAMEYLLSEKEFHSGNGYSFEIFHSNINEFNLYLDDEWCLKNREYLDMKTYEGNYHE